MFEHEKRIVKEGGERGRRSKRHVVSNPFFDRSSIPKLARATKRWDPHGTIRPRQAAKRKSPFSSSGTRLEQGERCYRLENIKSLLSVMRARVRVANQLVNNILLLSLC